jgi:hypothetical protein
MTRPSKLATRRAASRKGARSRKRMQEARAKRELVVSREDEPKEKAS